jgi:hypothetical protein
MSIHTAIVAGFASLLLCSCYRSLSLDGIDEGLLVAEADVLIARAAPDPSKKMIPSYDLRPEDWPPMIRKLNPRQVRYSYRGVWLLGSKWFSKEQGLFIPNPEGRSQHKAREVKKGIFEYSNG